MSEDRGRFSEWSNADLVAQCRMQARETLDPELTQFLVTVASRLSAAMGVSEEMLGISDDERLEYEARVLAAEMKAEQLRKIIKPFAARAILWNGPERADCADSTQVQHRLGDFKVAHKAYFGDPS